MTHTDKAAWRKVGEIAGWEPCIYELIEGGMLITGGIPATKGTKKKWPAKKLMQRVLLTEQDVVDEERRYEAETGNCYICYGTGKQTVGWSAKDGVKSRECPRCKGAGRVT
jgi:hypothetical protein